MFLIPSIITVLLDVMDLLRHGLMAVLSYTTADVILAACVRANLATLEVLSEHASQPEGVGRGGYGEWLISTIWVIECPYSA